MADGKPPTLLWSDAGARPNRKLRMMVLADAKAGKTVTCVGTAPGPVFVINADQDDSLDLVTAHFPKARFAWSNRVVREKDDFERELWRASKLVRAGEIQTVIFDTLTTFDRHLIQEMENLNADGRKFYPAYEKNLLNCVEQLLELPAHVIVCAHYLDVGADESADYDKQGPGIVPLLQTKRVRKIMGSLFSQVVYMACDKNDTRHFYTSMKGVWGPGCRRKPGVERTKANVKTLMRALDMLPAKETNGKSEGDASE